MSQKQIASRSSAKPRSADLFEKQSGSDKLCSAYLVDSESKADSDSHRPRKAPVGLRGGGRLSHSLAEKLTARTIHQPNGCWEVQGYPNRSGHQQISVGSPWNQPYVRVKAHVFAWEQANGRTVPPGMVIMHICDNPPCVNPAHLRLGTQRDNIIDSIHKGRYNCFGRQKLDAQKVRRIRELAAQGALTYKAIGKLFGVGRSAISAVISGATWSHVPGPFVGSAAETSVPSLTGN